jgi:hypothetical protein
VDEDEDAGVLVELLDAPEGHFEVLEYLFVLVAVVFNLEHIDQHLDSSKNCLLLHQKVLLHEGVLTSAIPQIEGQGSHELELVLLPFNCVPYLLGILRWEVREDHRVHRGFTGT